MHKEFTWQAIAALSAYSQKDRPRTGLTEEQANRLAAAAESAWAALRDTESDNAIVKFIEAQDELARVVTELQLTLSREIHWTNEQTWYDVECRSAFEMELLREEERQHERQREAALRKRKRLLTGVLLAGAVILAGVIVLATSGMP